MGGTIGFRARPARAAASGSRSRWEDVEPPAGKTPDAAAVLRPRPLRALDVLIAEDNESISSVAELIVVHAGHGVALADNGRPAVEGANGKDYDVILMDLQIRSWTAVAAAKEIRQLPGRAGQVPIVA